MSLATRSALADWWRRRWPRRWLLVPAFLCVGALVLRGLAARPEVAEGLRAWLFVLQWDAATTFIAAAVLCLLLALAWSVPSETLPSAVRAPPWGRWPAWGLLWRDLRWLLWLAWFWAEPVSALLLLAAWALWRATLAIKGSLRQRLVAPAPSGTRVARGWQLLLRAPRSLVSFLTRLLFWWPLRLASTLLALLDRISAWLGWLLRLAAKPALVACGLWLAGALLALALNLWRVDLDTLPDRPDAKSIDQRAVLLASPALMQLLRLRQWGDGVQAMLAAQRLRQALSAADRAAVAAALRAAAVDGRVLLASRGSGDALSGQQAPFGGLPPLLQQALDDTGLTLALADSRLSADHVLRAAEGELAGRGGVPTDMFIAAAKRQGLRIDPLDAAGVGHPALVRWALETPGAIAARDWQGRTPTMAALETLASVQADRPDHVAALQASVRLLLAEPQDLHLRDKAGRSLAFFALMARQPAAVTQRLIAAVGADARTMGGATLAHAVALSKADADDIRAMGLADLALPWSATSVDGQTPLHWVRSLAVLRWMMAERGVDPNLADHQGRTALRAAILRGDQQMAYHLARFTSNLQAVDVRGRTAGDELPLPTGKLGNLPWFDLRSILTEAAQPRSSP